MAAVLKLFPVLYCSIAYMSYLLIAAANGVVIATEKKLPSIFYNYKFPSFYFLLKPEQEG